MQPWIPVVITVALGVVGLSIQAALLAFFIGRMKESQLGQASLVAAFQDFTQKAIDSLMDRMKAVDAVGVESTADRAVINARLGAIEICVEGLPKLREDFAAHRATSEAHHKRVEQELNRVHQSLDGVQRQLGNLAVHGPGQLVELGKR